jgi:hypothetical protein
VTKRDRTRNAFDGHRAISRDMLLTMVLLRWITVAAVLLGIAALASGDENARATPESARAERSVDAQGVRCGEERSR